MLLLFLKFLIVTLFFPMIKIIKTFWKLDIRSIIYFVKYTYTEINYWRYEYYVLLNRLYLFGHFSQVKFFSGPSVQISLGKLANSLLSSQPSTFALETTSFNTLQFVPNLYLKKTSSQVKHRMYPSENDRKISKIFEYSLVFHNKHRMAHNLHVFKCCSWK